MEAGIVSHHAGHGFRDRVAGLASGLAIFGILGGALVVVGDVAMRSLANTAVVGLNEIMGQVFAMATAAALPAGAVRRIDLRVDLLANFFGPRVTWVLNALGSLLLATFFAVIAWRLFELAERAVAQGRDTLLLNWPLAPTYYFVAVAATLTALIQLWNFVEDLKTPVRPSLATRAGGWLLILVTGGVAGGMAIWAAVDFDGLSSFAQTSPGLFVLLAFLLLWTGVLLQLPLAAISALIGLSGTVLFIGGRAAGNTLATDAMEFLSNPQVATLPLFLLMGSFAVTAGVSQDIYQLANALLGRVKGGLAYATVAGCAGFGAVSGSSVATAATFGRVALPEMGRLGYSARLASGTVAAGGTLGSLVPPSGAIILFALLTETSIATLFVAAMGPALLALLLYFAAIWIQIRLDPSLVPAHDDEPPPVLPALRQALPVIALFTVVIGGLYSGFFTATESAAVGAVSAFVLAVARGRLARSSFVSVMLETTTTIALIYGLIFGAQAFAFFVNIGQATDAVGAFITSLDLTPLLVLALLLLFYLLLGAVMDSFAVMVITVPIITPVVVALGFDVYYWGILMLIVVEIGLISPPFGINLFVLKSLQSSVSLGTVMRGVLPFIAADIVKIAILLMVPAIALWLPAALQ